MNDKIKVIFFINSYLGGAERMTLNIAEFLDEDLYQVSFYVIGKDCELINKFISKDKEVKLLRVKSYKDFLLFKIISIIIKERPNYVFSSLMPINWRLCFASALFSKVKVIVRVNNYLYTQSLIQKLRLFIAYRFARKLIVQTTEMQDEHINILKLNRNKIITLSNPVNMNAIIKKTQYAPSPYNNKHINYLFVGRVDIVKGIDTLILAFDNVLKAQPNALLYIVGETRGIFEDYYIQLIKLVNELKIEEKVIFTGFTSNPYVYMKYADCFVLPSRNEGLPNVVIESLFLGTPVAVTCCVPVINRIVRNGIDGHVVEVDDIKGLASAMISSVKLGRVISVYKSATKDDFQALFK